MVWIDVSQTVLSSVRLVSEQTASYWGLRGQWAAAGKASCADHCRCLRAAWGRDCEDGVEVAQLGFQDADAVFELRDELGLAAQVV